MAINLQKERHNNYFRRVARSSKGLSLKMKILILRNRNCMSYE